MYADENVITIKHRVLTEVARLAFEGKLDEERDHIDSGTAPTVSMLYLQGKRNHPSESTSGGREGSGD